MKRIAVLLLALMLMSSSMAEGVLVTYFSRAGENYNVGVIEEGNTAKLAKAIAAQTGADATAKAVSDWQSGLGM